MGLLRFTESVHADWEPCHTALLTALQAHYGTDFALMIDVPNTALTVFLVSADIQAWELHEEVLDVLREVDAELEAQLLISHMGEDWSLSGFPQADLWLAEHDGNVH